MSTLPTENTRKQGTVSVKKVKKEGHIKNRIK